MGIKLNNITGIQNSRFGVLETPDLPITGLSLVTGLPTLTTSYVLGGYSDSTHYYLGYSGNSGFCRINKRTKVLENITTSSSGYAYSLAGDNQGVYVTYSTGTGRKYDKTTQSTTIQYNIAGTDIKVYGDNLYILRSNGSVRAFNKHTGDVIGDTPAGGISNGGTGYYYSVSISDSKIYTVSGTALRIYNKSTLALITSKTLPRAANNVIYNDGLLYMVGSSGSFVFDAETYTFVRNINNFGGLALDVDHQFIYTSNGVGCIVYDKETYVEYTRFTVGNSVRTIDAGREDIVIGADNNTYKVIQKHF